MKTWTVPGKLLVILSLVLTSCKLPAPSSVEPTVSGPQAVFTNAAQTAEARRLELASQTPDPESAIETAIAPTPTTEELPTQEITSTEPITSTAGTKPPDAGTGGDKADFVQDLTIPDGTTLSPAEAFEKTWRLKNVGTTTWTTDYTLVFIDGELMGADASVPIPEEVAPDALVDVTVKMTAPEKPGNYRSYWELRNAEGKIFGFGSNSDESIWVDITVQGSAASAATPSAQVNTIVDKVSLSVNYDSVSDLCPYTFIFTAQLNLKKASTITYQLELGDNSGSNVTLPPPATLNLEAGVHPVVYELTFPKTVSGWARLAIVDPEQAISNQVDFSLTCLSNI